MWLLPQKKKNVASNSSTLVEKVKLNSFMWLKANPPFIGFSYHD